MKKNNYSPSNLRQIEKKIASINGFGGVDYSTRKFLVDQNRAIDLKNFIYKDGVIQKRNGYEEILKVKKQHYIPLGFDGINKNNGNSKENKSNINGIWRFKAEDGFYHVVAHIGYLLYEINNISYKNIEAVPIATKYENDNQGNPRPVCYEFEDFKSCAFVGGNKLWFLGGNQYVCIRFQEATEEGTITVLEDSEITPIPTTTMSITYTDSPIAQRHSLDKVNLLTQWRKNKCISGTFIDRGDNIRTSTFWEYQLDTSIKEKSQKDLNDIEVIITKLTPQKEE